MSLDQFLQTTIAVGGASSLMFRSCAGSIPMSDTFFHYWLTVTGERLALSTFVHMK